ncbi:Pycsar system effector family protein [Thermoactinospora rubra]|uniref:Pycsar system effector family protein n=1 Tax=Thermoactinospora rubra TaxID=1088767 RepID=UPI000A11C23B|nr:Pycsar system effector family protein [Thermoactinospora rubra]
MNQDPAASGARSRDDGSAHRLDISPVVRDRLAAAATVARAELISDSQQRAGLLLSWAGVAYGVVVTLILTGPARFPGIGRFGVIVALIMLSAAVMLILVTIRPVSAKRGPRIFSYAEASTPQALIERLNAETANYELLMATDALQLVRVARTKNRNLRWAVDLIVTGITIMTITVFLERLI